MCAQHLYSQMLTVLLLAGKPGIAFVEYNSEAQSGTAMHGLQGFKVRAHTCTVSRFSAIPPVDSVDSAVTAVY